MFKLGFLGASKTGTMLARYFKAKGLCVTGFYSVNQISLDVTTKLVETKSYADINSLVSNSNIIFITPKDDKIIALWDQIDKSLLADKLICHCSGLLTSDIFANSTCLTASIHPMTSFNSKTADINLLDKLTFAIEGCDSAITILKEVLRTTNNPSIQLDKNKKTQYHIACVAVTSLYIGLLSFSKNLLNGSTIDGTDVQNSLLSQFTDGIIKKIANGENLADIITGPVIREDFNTIDKHVQFLSKENKQIYQLLSKQLLQLLPAEQINHTQILNSLFSKDAICLP